MSDLRLVTAHDVEDALAAHSHHPRSDVTYLAGGTTVVDLMKLGVLTPDVLVDLQPLRDRHATIGLDADGATIGALATMAEVAAHPGVARAFPAAAEALRLAASPQIRNAATIGGNLLQRTRCPYFRDGRSACNKRRPGSGCAARGGDRRSLAVLGTSSACIANYPGDLAVALAALDARITVTGVDRRVRSLAVEDLHRAPGDTPHVETTLEPGDVLTEVRIPRGGWHASTYVKVRDRASYAFALTSAAVALRLDDRNQVADVRVVVGGLAATPWRCRNAEELLRGQLLTRGPVDAAAIAALDGARPDDEQQFKVDLGRRTVVRALLDAAARARRARTG